MILDIEIIPKFEVKNKKILSLIYTPGVAKSSIAIKEKPDRVFDLTNRSNSIAILSHNYETSLKRAIYIKKTKNIDAYPLEIANCPEEDTNFVIENIMPNFMGVDRALLDGKDIEAECDIPTMSKNCLIMGAIEEMEPVRLREAFQGVIETRTVVKNGSEYEKPVAIVSDGSAVLGLGNIGAFGALPVMEGKAALFYSLADVNAMPLCLNTQIPDEIIKICTLLQNSFSGINLEDISAPRCFAIEEKLIETLGIPVFHDDQHGTATIVVAGLLNALEVVNKNLEDIKIIMSGAGAAGCAICKLLLKVGVKNITMFDKDGIVKTSRPQNDSYLEQLAQKTNLENLNVPLSEAIKEADVFIGVSAPNILTSEMVSSMASDAIVFALANPTPEIMPDVAKSAGAKIVATGRSDFSNQINNSLVFPGLFRGVIDSKIKKITDEIKLLAATSLAESVLPSELEENYIIPDALDKDVAKNISACIINHVRKS